MYYYGMSSLFGQQKVLVNRGGYQPAPAYAFPCINASLWDALRDMKLETAFKVRSAFPVANFFFREAVNQMVHFSLAFPEPRLPR